MTLSSGPPAATLVFQTLLTQGPLTRAELGRRTGLSSGAVTRVSTPLLSDGWITEVGPPPGARQPGRPATLVAVRPDRARFIGLKITADELIGVLADLTMAPLVTRRAALGSRDVGTVVSGVARLVGELTTDAAGHAVHSVGVTIAGDVDGSTGVVRWSPFLDWRGVRLGELTESATGVPTVIENDVRALTVAEQWFGAGAGLSSFALVTVGAGIGCGISVGGRLVSGAHGVSGEIGHLPVGGALGLAPVCTCGNTGCVEAIASSRAIVDRAREETGDPLLTLADAVRLAHQGHAEVRAVFTRAGRALGLAIASVANLIGPERIIISGEGVASYDLFADEIRQTFTAQAFGTAADCDLVVRPLPFEAWARGAAAVAAQRLFAPAATAAPLAGDR